MGELRVAQAELVGWLEGLTAAIQSVMVAEAARRERDGQGPR
ncbi:MAG TPA: proteasome activator [Actinomycetota bacterium]|nr:proteasome activator [Actinomycetota bacterium]